jgi:glycerol-3-phosphate acyltransferase PlsX
MLTIGIDLFGGDHAPQAVLQGLAEALPYLPENCQVHLFGNREDAKNLAAAHPQISLTHTTDFIGMDEHPIKALQAKPENAMSLGLQALAKQQIQVFASAGHTGALMVSALQILGLQAGVKRPAVASFIPTLAGGAHLVIDVGANTDSKSENLVESARLGSVYFSRHTGQKQPPVYLLNTGKEASKGRQMHQTAYALLQEREDLRFCGNLEVRALYTAPAAVLVTDGYTGNIVLKQTEAFFQLAQARHINDEFIKTLNYENYGGSPILGLNGQVVVGHGASNATALKNMILTSATLAKANL